MGLTFDSPVSLRTTTYDKVHNPESAVLIFPSGARKASSSNSLLDKVTQHVHIHNPFHHSSTSTPSASSKPVSNVTKTPPKPVPAADSPFFRLPLELRETIYGLVVGRHEILHIMMKRRPWRLRDSLAHRRCRAGGNLDDCVLHDCKRFLDQARRGVYFGSFSDVGGLLFSCRDIFEEVSDVLYQQNTLDFGHPLCLMIFSKTVCPDSLNCIRSISINLQRELYNDGSPYDINKSMLHDEWPQMWDIIAGMEGLREIRVRFRFPVNGWLGWSEEEVLEPLWKVTRPMRVFEVDSRKAIGFQDEMIAARAPFKLLVSVPRKEA